MQTTVLQPVLKLFLMHVPAQTCEHTFQQIEIMTSFSAGSLVLDSILFFFEKTHGPCRLTNKLHQIERPFLLCHEKMILSSSDDRLQVNRAPLQDKIRSDMSRMTNSMDLHRLTIFSCFRCELHLRKYMM